MGFSALSRLLLALFLFSSHYTLQAAAQTAASATIATPPITNTTSSTRTPTITSSSSSVAPDVYLSVPTLSVGRIELDVENLSADLNLAAKVANLVTVNAGVQVGITKVNLTIVDVDVELELNVRLGHLVDIVSRVFQSLDLNPLLINTLNNVTSDVTGLLDNVVGAVDGLLGSITQGGTTLGFIVDNLGNIVQQVNGGASTIVGNYLQNMTETGTAQNLGSGLTQKTYEYSPLGALVNIVFNTAGQVVQATVNKAGGSASSGSSVVSSTVAPSAAGSTAASSAVSTTAVASATGANSTST